MADPARATLLLVEDETEAGGLLMEFLQRKGYQVHWAVTGQQALGLLEKYGSRLGAAILDSMVPAPDGPALLRTIRGGSYTTAALPVLFLTAKDREQDELQLLALGADDYLAKPASLARILARVETLLRRAGSGNGTPDSLGPLQHDAPNRRMLLEGKLMDLTTAEYQLLAVLLQHPTRVFTRAELLAHASPEPDAALERTVDAHIKNIRLKLGSHNGLIKTYRGMGYGLSLED